MLVKLFFPAMIALTAIVVAVLIRMLEPGRRPQGRQSTGYRAKPRR